MLVRLKPRSAGAQHIYVSKHGWLYIVKRKYGPIYHCKSLASGGLVSINRAHLEEAPGAHPS